MTQRQADQCKLISATCPLLTGCRIHRKKRIWGRDCIVTGDVYQNSMAIDDTLTDAVVYCCNALIPSLCLDPHTLPLATTCYNASNKGETYHGNHSTTESGTTCQQWSSQAPHIHPITPLFRRYLEGHNYCRNPEGRGSRPWCYTTDPSTRWQYCNIPVCKPEEPVDSNETYLCHWAITTSQPQSLYRSRRLFCSSHFKVLHKYFVVEIFVGIRYHENFNTNI